MLNAVLLSVKFYQLIVFNRFNFDLYKNRRSHQIENIYEFLFPFMLVRSCLW
jgi:hypothetical protein